MIFDNQMQEFAAILFIAVLAFIVGRQSGISVGYYKGRRALRKEQSQQVGR